MTAAHYQNSVAKYPPTLLVDMGESLAALHGFVKRQDFTIGRDDVAEIIAQILGRLMDQGIQISEYDYLMQFENLPQWDRLIIGNTITDRQKTIVRMATLYVAKDIRHTLQHLGAFDPNGKLSYYLDQVIDGNLIMRYLPY